MAMKPLYKNVYKMSSGQKITRFYYKGNYTKQEIRDKVQKMSNMAKKEGKKGTLAVALEYQNIGKYFAGQLRNFGEPVFLFNLREYERFRNIDEPDNHDSFTVYVIDDPPSAGGLSKTNDCLYECLVECLLKVPWKTPKALKSYLGLKYDEPIDIKLIPKVEEKLDQYKVKISVTGDHTYISPKPHAATVFVKLEQGHYSVDKKKTLPIKGISRYEKPIVIYHPETMLAYDGKVFFETTKLEVNDLKGKRIFVTEDDFYEDVRDTKDEMTEKKISPINEKSILEYKYNQFISEINMLKNESDGLINLYKTGTKRVTVLDLFTKCDKLSHPDQIKQDEAKWIQDSTTGAIIFASKGKYDVAYKYDVRSRYPSIMAHKNTLFPVKRGSFEIIKEIAFDKNGNCPYGIYHATIEEKQSMQHFRYNNLNKYTHHDLYLANKLGLKITLIQNGEVNALIYTRDKLMSGRFMFEKYVTILYALKEKGIKIAKLLLNSLWGMLTQAIKYQIIFNKDNAVLKKGRSIRSIRPAADLKSDVVEIVENEKMFRTGYARMKPFLLAEGRKLIVSRMLPFIDKVIRCHTDGFITTEQLPEKVLGSKMGYLKYEGVVKDINILNKNRYI